MRSRVCSTVLGEHWKNFKEQQVGRFQKCSICLLGRGIQFSMYGSKSSTLQVYLAQQSMQEITQHLLHKITQWPLQQPGDAPLGLIRTHSTSSVISRVRVLLTVSWRGWPGCCSRMAHSQNLTSLAALPLTKPLHMHNPVSLAVSCRWGAVSDRALTKPYHHKVHSQAALSVLLLLD